MSISERLARLEKSLAPAASQDCSLCGECLCLKRCRRCEHRRRKCTVSRYDPSKGIPFSESKTCEACGRRRATKIVFNIARTTGVHDD